MGIILLSQILEVSKLMLPMAEKLYVEAQSDLCEMYKLFIQQYGQRYPSP